jgi:hypothetical protein
MARRGRKRVEIPCAYCGGMNLKRIKSQPDGQSGEIRIYECRDCPRDKTTMTREAWWGDGRSHRRYFPPAEDSVRVVLYRPE